MKRDSCLFYRSFYDALSDLSDAEKLACYNAIFGYALDGIEPADKGIVSAVFKLVKPVIDRNNESFKNGQKGGRPKTETEPIENPSKTQLKPVCIPNKDKDKDKDIKENKKQYAQSAAEDAAIRSFIEHRKKLRKPMTDKAVELFIKRLNGMADTEAGRIALIETAIERGWQTVYEANQPAKKKTGFDYENQRRYSAEDYAELERKLRAR